MTSCVNINTAQLSAAPADDLVDFFNMEKKKRASNLLQDEKVLLVELVTKYRTLIECKATDVAAVTRSQAVARIADRTASQDSSNYNDCVIRPSIL